MSTGGPDLFVICKNCQSEVSPYITECPYCGSRLRKRAPKIDREGRPTERKRRAPAPSLPRLRRDEIPGIRGESHPYATIALVLAGFAGTLLWRAALVGSTHAIQLWAQYGTHLWWRLLAATFAVQVSQAIVLAACARVFFSGGPAGLGLSVTGSVVDLLLCLCLLYVLVRIPFWAKQLAFGGRGSGTVRLVKAYAIGRAIGSVL